MKLIKGADAPAVPPAKNVPSEICVGAFDFGSFIFDPESFFPLLENGNRPVEGSSEEDCAKRSVLQGKDTFGLQTVGDSTRCFLGLSSEASFTLLGEAGVNDTDVADVTRVLVDPFQVIAIYINDNIVEQAISTGAVRIVENFAPEDDLTWTTRILKCAELAIEDESEFFGIFDKTTCVMSDWQALADDSQLDVDLNPGAFTCNDPETFYSAINNEGKFALFGFTSLNSENIRLKAFNEKCIVDSDCAFAVNGTCSPDFQVCKTTTPIVTSVYLGVVLGITVIVIFLANIPWGSCCSCSCKKRKAAAEGDEPKKKRKGSTVTNVFTGQQISKTEDCYNTLASQFNKAERLLFGSLDLERQLNSGRVNINIRKQYPFFKLAVRLFQVGSSAHLMMIRETRERLNNEIKTKLANGEQIDAGEHRAHLQEELIAIESRYWPLLHCFNLLNNATYNLTPFTTEAMSAILTALFLLRDNLMESHVIQMFPTPEYDVAELVGDVDGAKPSDAMVLDGDFGEKGSEGKPHSGSDEHEDNYSQAAAPRRPAGQQGGDGFAYHTATQEKTPPDLYYVVNQAPAPVKRTLSIAEHSDFGIVCRYKSETDKSLVSTGLKYDVSHDAIVNKKDSRIVFSVNNGPVASNVKTLVSKLSEKVQSEVATLLSKHTSNGKLSDGMLASVIPDIVKAQRQHEADHNAGEYDETTGDRGNMVAANALIKQALSVCGDSRMPPSAFGENIVLAVSKPPKVTMVGRTKAYLKTVFKIPKSAHMVHLLVFNGFPLFIMLSFLAKINQGARSLDQGLKFEEAPRIAGFGNTYLPVPEYYALDRRGSANGVEAAQAIEAQKFLVPVIYGLMHIALYFFAILPFTMCQELFEYIRTRWFAGIGEVIPMQKMRELHIDMGTRMLECVLAGAILFLVLMGGSMAVGAENAGFAFQPVNGENFFDDIFSNVLLLRVILIPVLPLLFLMYYEYKAPAFITRFAPGFIINSWFEVVYGIHLLVASVGILMVVIIRLQVFYIALATWSIYLLNKLLRTWMTAPASASYVRFMASSENVHKTKVIRLQLKMPNWYKALPGQAIWLTVPSLDLVSHAFTLAKVPQRFISADEEQTLIEPLRDLNIRVPQAILDYADLIEHGEIGAAKVATKGESMQVSDNTIELHIGVKEPTYMRKPRKRKTNTKHESESPEGEKEGEQENNDLEASMWSGDTFGKDDDGLVAGKKKVVTWTQRLAHRLNSGNVAERAGWFKCYVSSPLGSSMDQCLSPRSAGSIIITSGNGIPAGESSLRQILMPGRPRPSIFFFVWSARDPDELLAIIESVRNQICTAIVRGVLSIEGLHSEYSTMIDWLGLTMQVSSATPATIDQVRKDLNGVIRPWENPYGAPEEIEMRVRQWLLSRIQPGRCNFPNLLVKANEVIKARTGSEHMAVGYCGSGQLARSIKNVTKQIGNTVTFRGEYI